MIDCVEKYNPFYVYRSRGFDYAVAPKKGDDDFFYVAISPSDNVIYAWYNKRGELCEVSKGEKKKQGTSRLPKRIRRVYRQLPDKILGFLRSV